MGLHYCAQGSYLMTDVHASAANSLMQSARHVTANVHIPICITNCLEILNACSHSYLHLNISHYAECNIPLSCSFSASLISNCIKNTVQYIFLYISCVKMVRNSQNVTVGFQKLTFANLQYILRTAHSIMYLKQEKSPRFWFNHNEGIQ